MLTDGHMYGKTDPYIAPCLKQARQKQSLLAVVDVECLFNTGKTIHVLLCSHVAQIQTKVST